MKELSKINTVCIHKIRLECYKSMMGYKTYSAVVWLMAFKIWISLERNQTQNKFLNTYSALIAIPKWF